MRPARTKLTDLLREELSYGIDALHRHGVRLVLLFAVLLLPLWLFGELADGVREDESFFFDKPILEWMHVRHSEMWDAIFLFFSKIGYEWGVIPVDIALVLVLAFKRKLREGLFAGIALGGSAILNVAAKHYFGRERPRLWESITPEGTYSFPSGHAMGSMTLSAVLVLLAWPTRWRWPVIVAMAAFVPMVGISRVYLGVHYPSDILAGWSAALAWVIGCYVVLFGLRRPGLRS